MNHAVFVELDRLKALGATDIPCRNTPLQQGSALSCSYSAYDRSPDLQFMLVPPAGTQLVQLRGQPACKAAAQDYAHPCLERQQSGMWEFPVPASPRPAATAEAPWYTHVAPARCPLCATLSCVTAPWRSSLHPMTQTSSVFRWAAPSQPVMHPQQQQRPPPPPPAAAGSCSRLHCAAKPHHRPHHHRCRHRRHIQQQPTIPTHTPAPIHTPPRAARLLLHPLPPSPLSRRPSCQMPN